MYEILKWLALSPYFEKLYETIRRTNRRIRRVFGLIKTLIFKIVEYELICERDECVLALRDLALILSQVDLFLRNDRKLKLQNHGD